MTLFKLSLPLSFVIFLLTCINLRKDLKAFRVATKGIRVNAKIIALKDTIEDVRAQGFDLQR